MKIRKMFLVIIAATSGCGPHTNEEERFLIRNQTVTELIYQDFYNGKQGSNMLLSLSITEYVGAGDQLGVDSVKFIKGSKVLKFVNPKYDLATYEATKDWNFFNSKNWVQEKQNEFVYTVKEEFFK
jgi:hypothetical protein